MTIADNEHRMSTHSPLCGPKLKFHWDFVRAYNKSLGTKPFLVQRPFKGGPVGSGVPSETSFNPGGQA